MTQRKDADKIPRAKKKLKGLDLFPVGINSAAFINDNLCRYYLFMVFGLPMSP